MSDEPKNWKFTLPQSETSRCKQVYMKVLINQTNLFMDLCGELRGDMTLYFSVM